MPEISRFYGIVIKMYFAHHDPPHLHPEYAEREARIAINSLGVLSGNLPPRDGTRAGRTVCARRGADVPCLSAEGGIVCG